MCLETDGMSTIVEDVIAYLLLYYGRWFTTEADVITSLLGNGRCYSHVAE